MWIRNHRAFGYNLDEVAGLSRTMPWPALLLALFMISLTGIPPTIGFWAKFYLFTAVVNADLTWLAIVAVLMSSVSAYYYLRVVWYMYFREAPEGAEVVGGAWRAAARHRRGSWRRGRWACWSWASSRSRCWTRPQGAVRVVLGA